jgi:hypothetical protein
MSESQPLADPAAPKAISIPERPFMDPETLIFLDAHMRASHVYLEYGSGGSTRMAVGLRVPHIYSVESDHAFGRAVHQAVQHDLQGIDFQLFLPRVGPTGRWGYPTGTEHFQAWPEYPTSPWSALRRHGLSPDLVLVDGRFRVACFLATLVSARPGTRIIFDDFVGRGGKYGITEHYAPLRAMLGRAALFEVPEQVDLPAAALDLARYAVVPG